MRGRIGLFERLRREKDVLRDYLAGGPVQPRRRHPKGLPVLVETPENRRKPGHPPFDEHEAQGRILRENAFRDETDQVSQVAADETRVPFEIIRRVSGGSGSP